MGEAEDAKPKNKKVTQETIEDSEPTANEHKAKTSKNGSWNKNKRLLTIGGGVIGALIAIVALVLSISLNQKDYKIVDLSEMTIAEACSTAKSHGWKVNEPFSIKDSKSVDATRQIDCNNSTAKVADYTYSESSHEVSLYYNHKVDVARKSVNEALALLKATGWKEDGIVLLRCTTSYCGSGTILTVGDSTYDPEEPVKRSSIENGGKMYVFLEAKDEEKETNSANASTPNSSQDNSSNNANASSSSSSNSSSSSSSNGSGSEMCKSDYKKNLETAKTAYETAQKAYETYKKMGADSSALSQYQTALDVAKSSLDSVQKIYDTYCK